MQEGKRATARLLVFGMCTRRKVNMSDHDDVQQCQAEIKRLQAENQVLRKASETFADLAERLNQRLQSERGLKTSLAHPTQGPAPVGRTGSVDCARVQAAR